MGIPLFTRHRAAFRCSRDRPAELRTILFLLILCAMAWAAKGAADEVHRRTGRLAVRSPYSPTIVVDLRNCDTGSFLLAKVVADSNLRRGERPVGLHDFVVGETVKVTWRKAAEGAEIISLLAEEAENPASAGHQPLLSGPRGVGGFIGQKQRHKVQKEETFLDIARHHHLGFNEIVALHPEYDPWLPPVGKVLDIPGRWLLPEAPFEGLVVNITEMRLFAYQGAKDKLLVRTYPVGIGDTDFPTPTGTFRVGAKSVHPTWHVPPSLRAKYQQATFPPGPDNPLGDYWIGLAGTYYGIHGTDIPWSVGRLVTRGCIRMYPEDIADFFPTVASGTTVRLVYQPVKVALVSGRLLVEVHSDVYSKIDNLAVHGINIIGRLGLAHLLDELKFVKAIARQDGMPRDVTREVSGTGAAASEEDSCRVFIPHHR